MGTNCANADRPPESTAEMVTPWAGEARTVTVAWKVPDAEVVIEAGDIVETPPTTPRVMVLFGVKPWPVTVSGVPRAAELGDTEMVAVD